MTRPMSDSEICDMFDSANAALADAMDRIEALDKRVKVLEADTPGARQAQYELDVTLADNADYLYDYHGRDCQCPYCGTGEEVSP